MSLQARDRRSPSVLCLPPTMATLLPLLILTVAPLASTFTPLYTSRDPGIMLLEKINFTSTIKGKDSVFVVEFYNSWCGHCIRFAPIWKDMSKDVLGWHRVAKVGVIDCAEDRNTDLCREYDITLYPSIKYFWINNKPEDKEKDSANKGVLYGGAIEGVTPLRRGIVDFLVSSWSKGAPREWPDLMPMSALSKAQFVRMLPLNKNKPIMIVIENQTSYVGREVILDLSGYQRDVLVFRVLDLSKKLLNELLPLPADRYRLPLLIELDRNDYNVHVLYASSNDTRDDARETIVSIIQRKYIKYISSTSTVGPITELKRLSDKTSEEDHISYEHIHQVDLNNALRYSLYQQIPLHKELNSSQLLVFQRFLDVVKRHFPFSNENSSEFIQLLSRWLSTKVHSLEIEELKEAMTKFEEDYPLPAQQPYRGCRGSDRRYRGYPCSLWQLFHTMAANEFAGSPEQSSHAVLHTMKDYIASFFGCTECAQNFARESKGLEEELKYPNSSVAWLWRTHNGVNKRLAGDVTEDPQHPKIQFPAKGVCPECYNLDSSWNENQVIVFLVNRYSKKMIIKEGDKNGKEGMNRKAPVALVSGQVERSTISGKSWSYSLLNRTDISLCLILYILSAGLIISLFFIMKFRGRRKKMYNKLKHYP